MTSTTNPLPVKVVAGAVTGIDALLLLAAVVFTVDTWYQFSRPGDHSLTSLGYYVAGLCVVAATPSLVLAIIALRTRGAVAIACSALSVLVLAFSVVFAASY